LENDKKSRYRLRAKYYKDYGFEINDIIQCVLSTKDGEFNLGNMTFTYSAPLDYDQPVADAGENILVVLPENTAQLDGSNSSDPDGAELSYHWTQVYGPTTLEFSDDQVAQPTVSTLQEGVCLFTLTVDNGSYSDHDEVYVISSYSSNVAPKVSITSPVDQAEYYEFDPVVISATASDLNGYVMKVDFYADDKLIGSDTEPPYFIEWTSNTGDYGITAVAHDNDGDSTVSQVVSVSMIPAPPCEGTSYNGDFDYKFSPDDNNPTLTFIPSQPGVGNPTCILYYGTNANNLPGYFVTPNQPYQLNASEGTLIYFYYTYSWPGEGERNNSQHKDIYEIGSCNTLSVPDHPDELQVRYYPNPVTHQLNLELPPGNNTVGVFDLRGERLAEFKVSMGSSVFDMSTFDKGIYIFKIQNESSFTVFKVIK
jgi:hypothetical protein